jgi:hypothetical protein
MTPRCDEQPPPKMNDFHAALFMQSLLRWFLLYSGSRIIATLQSQPARHFMMTKKSPREGKEKLHGSKRSVERMLSMCNAVFIVD